MVNILCVSLGVAIFLASLVNFWRIYNTSSGRVNRLWWALLAAFVLFFLAGYLAYDFYLWRGLVFVHQETLISQVFLWGAVFVLLISSLFLTLVGSQKESVAEAVNQKDEAEKHSAELSRMNKYMVDRELKMIELKKEIERLKGKNNG